jgi:predicted HAD superfamily Cof-like phosphohydrolase
MSDYHKFNAMYNLPRPKVPTLPEGLALKITNFTKILRDEVEEGFDIIEKYHAGADQLELLTDIADWLHDLTVYCLTEAVKYGLPSNEILKIIMESNFSKLDENGQPIIDEFGKVLKGASYWKPEPRIMELLKEKQLGL